LEDFFWEMRDLHRGSARRLEANAERGEMGEGSRDKLERVEMEDKGIGRHVDSSEGGGDDRQQHGSGRRGWRSAAWLTSRGIKGEGEGDTDKWAPAIVQGGGVEFVSKLKFNRIQIKFKSIQTLADLKWTILSSKK
jgi:hypothetical protein